MTSWLKTILKQKTSPAREEPEDTSPVFCHGSSSALPDDIRTLVKQLCELPDMDKRTMSGRCEPETTRMEKFMRSTFGMENIEGEYFVQGVRAFRLQKPVDSFQDDGKEVITFGEGTSSFSCSVSELRAWQSSFVAYAFDHVYEAKDDQGKKLIQKTLNGFSESGHEAWCAKFLCRISVCPILCEFDARIIPRSIGDASAGRVHLVSVSGVDFAGRHHDEKDITHYISNYDSVYHMSDDGQHLLVHSRDFYPTGVKPKLDAARLVNDLKIMARLRFRAQDQMGIQVCVETGIGLGVFAGDRIGIGDTVRTLTARAMREVLEEMEQEGKAKGRSTAFDSIRLIIFSLPVFRPHDNYEFFVQAFDGYKSDPAVLILDQDMHRIARHVSQTHVVSELNPADSHGVVGEYWQNRGPGTEEKLALTTLGLMTQHHVCNPAVLDLDRYHLMDAQPYKQTKHNNKDNKK